MAAEILRPALPAGGHGIAALRGAIWDFALNPRKEPPAMSDVREAVDLFMKGFA
jgi:hypothetical protein